MWPKLRRKWLGVDWTWSRLKKAPYDEAKARLMQLAGVGSKIADCVLAFSLEKMNAFPIDVWVRRALLEWYFPAGTKMSDKELLLWAQDYFGRLWGLLPAISVPWAQAAGPEKRGLGFQHQLSEEAPLFHHGVCLGRLG